MIDKKPWNCSVSFGKFSQLAKHNEEHQLEESMVVNGLKQNLKNGNTQGSKYKCKVCEGTFSDKNLLATHACAGRPAPRIFRCKTCPKEFLYMCKLVQHEKIHVMDKPYKCDVCCCSFSQPCHLGRHMMTHSASANTKCIICSKVFKNSAHLETHKLIHNTEKVFKCDLCPQTFTDLSRLTTHLNEHVNDKVNFEESSKEPLTKESITIPRNNKCKKKKLGVDRKLSFRSSRAKNLTAEPDDVFKRCKLFKKTARENLEVNSEFQKFEDSLMESEGKSENSLKKIAFVLFCDICHKDFNKKDEFEIHLKLHMMKECQEEYVCEVCNQFFNKSSLFESHVKKHHKENQILSNGVNKQYIPTRPSLFEKFDNLTPPEAAMLQMPITKQEILPMKSEKGLLFMDSAEDFVSSNFPTRAKRRLDGDFRCLICCESFANSFTLDFHLEKHIIVKTLPRNRHTIWSIRFPQKKFHCKICQKSFSQRMILQGHSRIMHRDINTILVQ